MDQHAIPQDVTGFQFKLIGNMTVKQFGYIAVGVIAAVILYYLPLHFALAFLIKALLIPTFGGSGFAIAFLPIDGRPLDVMAGNFFKAFTAPNQYVYHKVGYTFSFSTLTLAKAPTTPQAAPVTHQQHITNKELQLEKFLHSSQNQVHNALDEKEFAFLKKFATTAPPTPSTPILHNVAAQTHSPTVSHLAPTKPDLVPIHPVQIPLPIQVAKPAINPATTITHSASPMPTTMTTPPVQPPAMMPTAPIPSIHQAVPNAPVAANTIDVGTLIQEENALEKELDSAKIEEQKQQAPQIHEKVLTLEQQIQKIHAEKLRLEQELVKLKQQHDQAQKNLLPPSPQPKIVSIAPPTSSQMPSAQFSVAQVKATPAPLAKNTMVPHIPDTPNILVGLVKDSRGNVLPHILVEVKDKDGNPVRAFKTNALGQFASATPLTNGIYTIELEDPKRQNTFDVIQVVANNKIILPLEVISHDAREQLRRELFN